MLIIIIPGHGHHFLQENTHQIKAVTSCGTHKIDVKSARKRDEPAISRVQLDATV